jgi:hypothetical protein
MEFELEEAFEIEKYRRNLWETDDIEILREQALSNYKLCLMLHKNYEMMTEEIDLQIEANDPC